ncbi:MAG: 3D domain-containing protein [Phycisphaerales bacterium]
MKKPALNSSDYTMFNTHSRARAMGVLDGTAWLAALTLVITSAIWTKETGALPALVGIDQSNQRVQTSAALESSAVDPIADVLGQETTAEIQAPEHPVGELILEEEPVAELPIDPSYRWFDGKLIRPARVMYMTVTGYSPDARSCGIFADGKTATMNSVWTNGMKLVAADPTVLPYWSLISVPGYAKSEVVPVLDCGGAIKGNRLDLLYPTHKMALQWGVRQVPVTVWEYVESEQN